MTKVALRHLLGPLLIFQILVFKALVSSSNVNDFFTSKAMSLDEWLSSEDLFPGHEIPQNTHHSEAVKIFSRVLEDPHILSEAYEKYRIQHNKDLETDISRIEMRRAHFRDNLHLIFHHNLQHDADQSRFQLGVNNFADMSKEELKAFLGSKDKLNFPIHPKNFNSSTGPNNPQIIPQPPAQFPNSAASLIFPISFDFREEHVSPIKNQKKCGSCVFFAFAALLESLYATKFNGAIINLSEQMMLDCATKEHGYKHNDGCDGNIMEDTAQFLVDHGVTSEDIYKYEAKQGDCAKADKEVVAKLKDFWQVNSTVEGFKDTLVNQKLPIATAFLVYHQFMFYRSGVFDMCVPPNGAIGGHAVLITGYGHFIDQGYWMVKNSWGQKWGEAGFFRYAAGDPFCRFERWGFTGTLA